MMATAATISSSSTTLLRLVILSCCSKFLVAFIRLEGRISRSKPNTLSTRHDQKLQEVSVFDGVFTQEACQELHHLAVEHAERGRDGSSIFYRFQASLTPLEYALNSTLAALGDCNEICEYWSRNEYLHMDVHADIDEQELDDDGVIRCPEQGHVLYLDVDPKIRAGPTCVFSQFGGWSNPRQEENATTSMVTVPVVQGRLLRFPGSAMHAVPKPPTRWFFTDEEVQLLDGDDDADEMWDDNEEYQVERSVILFNTWSMEGPRGVTEDYSKGTMPDGIELDEDDDDDDYMEQQKQQRVMEWQEDYGKDCRGLWCQPNSEWRQVPIEEDKSPADTAVRVSLMGKRIRRRHPQQHVQLLGPTSLRIALDEDGLPRRFQLIQN